MIVTKTAELTKPCEDISIDEGFKLIDKLNSILEQENGIGLAANQIGINKKVCILRIPDSETGEIIGHNFINPKITRREEPITFENEGCLSYPNVFIRTIRYNKVTVVDDLSPEGRDFEGLEAVCAQHEVDHLFGKTMHMSKVKVIGRNSLCPCESGKKFKKCCMPHLDKKRN
jgi:peptide deformylase